MCPPLISFGRNDRHNGGRRDDEKVSGMIFPDTESNLKILFVSLLLHSDIGVCAVIPLRLCD